MQRGRSRAPLPSGLGRRPRRPLPASARRTAWFIRARSTLSHTCRGSSRGHTASRCPQSLRRKGSSKGASSRGHLHSPAGQADRSTDSRRSGSEPPPSSGHRPFPGVPRCAPRARVTATAKSSPTCAPVDIDEAEEGLGLRPGSSARSSSSVGCGDHRRRISVSRGQPVGEAAHGGLFASLIQ